MDLWEFSHLNNVGLTLTETAKHVPGTVAVAAPLKQQRSAVERVKRLYSKKSGASQSDTPAEFETVTFFELEKMSNRFAVALRAGGVQPGDRIGLMVPPGIEFVALVFALFKTGAVQILIDPGMGRDNLVKCLSDTKPVGIVGSRKAHSARLAYRKWFPDAKKNFVVGGGFPRCKKLTSSGPSDFEPATTTPDDEAAIIFTTGSTGPPKGVLYRHRTFIQQAAWIRDWFHVQPGGADISGFPLFALFNTAMGTSTVFPDMDPTRPADIWPPNFIHAAEKFSADQSFGSPALWNTVSLYCEKHNIKLDTIKRVFTAGAPVPPNVLARTKSVIADDGEVHTPYGATESLPVACISGREVLEETADQSATGAGTCVGWKFPEIDWRLIEITDEPLRSIDSTVEVQQGEIGELIVRGPVVTDQYVTQTNANLHHKIADGDTFWHRMGDVGYFDDRGRFWFCGRKSHRLLTESGTLFTVPCESIFNSHKKVYRCALVPAGKPGAQVPVVFVELLPEQKTDNAAFLKRIESELLELAGKHWQTNQIRFFSVVDSLPVDIRHNSKIFREKLRSRANSIVDPKPL